MSASFISDGYSDGLTREEAMTGVDYDFKPSKRSKALEYMRQYVASFPDQEVTSDWLYQITIGEFTPTLDAMVVLFGNVDALPELPGSSLKYLIDKIK